MSENLPAVPQGQDLALPQTLRLNQLLPRELDESAVKYIGRLMEILPAPTDDVVEKMAEALLATESPMEENEFWDQETIGTRKVVGRSFIFRRIHALPSTYPDSKLPFFLICQVTESSTGEELLLNTGSFMICQSLVRAALLGNLPWQAEIVGPKRPTRNANTPLRLRWLAKVIDPEPEDIDV